MSNDLSKVPDSAVHRADVVFHGEKIMLPEGMSIPSAIEVLTERLAFLKQKIQLSETYDVFPWDGARGLSKVLQQRFGWTAVTGHPSFFGPTPPKVVNIEVGPGEVDGILWGVFTLPTCNCAMSCGTGRKDGRLVFKVDCELLRGDEKFVRQILSDLREYLKHNSLYRGKAIKLSLTNDAGKVLPMPEPKFMDTNAVDRSQLILSADVHAAVETNLFTPIERVRDLLANGLPIKRGVLLGGVYGTGKTLTARVASKLAVENGITFIYIAKASDLAQAVLFAEQYASPAAVIFCEDIDREVTGERTAKMDEVLNIVDGLDTKNSKIIVVLTTNHLDKVNQAMLRPGRLDAVIEVTNPDAGAVEKLFRYYGGDSISAKASLASIGKELEGCIPAVIAEVVKRAKLSQMRLQPKGTPVGVLSEEALFEAARTMRRQLALLEPKAEVKKDSLTEAMQSTVKGALNGGQPLSSHAVKQLADAVAERLS